MLIPGLILAQVILFSVSCVGSWRGTLGIHDIRGIEIKYAHD